MSLLVGGLHIAMAQTTVVVTAIAFYAVSRDAPQSVKESVHPAWWRSTQVAALILATGFCAAAVQLYLPMCTRGLVFASLDRTNFHPLR
jgi:hypothetical protein